MTGRTDMRSVSEVLVPGFGRSWHECVAIVQEAASLLHSGAPLPDPTDLFFEDSGTLTFGFGSESSQHPVAGLAALLQQLLEGVEAPASLLELAAQNGSPTPRLATVDDFARALAFFERPNRGNDLRAISARLGGAPQKSEPEQEFDKLRERIATKSEQTKESEPEKQPEKKKARRKLTRKQQRIVAAGLPAGLLLSFLIFGGSSARRVGTAVNHVELGVSSLISAVMDRFGVSKSASAAPGPEAVEKEKDIGTAGSDKTRAESTRSPHVNDRNRSASRPNPAAADNRAPARAINSTAGSSSPGPMEPLRAVPLPSVPPGVPDPLPLPPVSGVYTRDTPGIVPAVLVRPQMPKEPPPGADTGYFDMIVDESGTVEQVKLISPRRRYHDRMLVAAAKAWKFKPAILNGQPVKFRVLIPIILTGLPY